jgi:hypothetical protein
LTDPARRKVAFQRTMLLLYINEARLTLHRTWFVRVLQEYPLEPLLSPQSQSYIDCLEACRGIVGLVRNMLALHGELIQRRWHFFFHLFSACVCLATAVIRCPTSSLAVAVLAELDNGMALFRMAGRDELVSLFGDVCSSQVTLDRLRATATQGMETGRSPQAFAESEDLELLGARRAPQPSTWGSLPYAGPFGIAGDPELDIDSALELEEASSAVGIRGLLNLKDTAY